jgi:tripartite-type tricarboxylate transporter receptor subunit TctC
MSADLLPHVRSGKLRGLAIQGEKRYELFPEIPTFSEIGYKAESPLWMAVSTPKGVDPRIIKKLFDAFKQAQEHPSFKELCATLYLRPVFRDSETLKNMVFRDFDSQKIILKELGLAKP